MVLKFKQRAMDVDLEIERKKKDRKVFFLIVEEGLFIGGPQVDSE